jgi:hypothetical protein
MKLFNPTCDVILRIIYEETTSSQRAETDSVHQAITLFEFVLILHLLKEIMQITDYYVKNCNQNLNILNIMHLVSSTKVYIQQYRDNKWDALLANLKSFCEKHKIDVLDMNARYVERQG